MAIRPVSTLGAVGLFPRFQQNYYFTGSCTPCYTYQVLNSMKLAKHPNFFSRLPRELRDRMWRFVTDEPDILIKQMEEKEPRDHWTPLCSINAVPAVFHICCESRSEALKIYIETWRDPLHFDIQPLPVYYPIHGQFVWTEFIDRYRQIYYSKRKILYLVGLKTKRSWRDEAGRSGRRMANVILRSVHQRLSPLTEIREEHIEIASW